MSILTKAIIEEMNLIVSGRVAEYNTQLFCSPALYADILEYQRWENWVKSLGPRKEKQVRLKRRLNEKRLYTKVLPLPN